MFFFVKVRIDLNKLSELGHKLQKGELDISSIRSTYCIKDDPSVGLNIWEAEDKEDFEMKFKPHKEYYTDVIEIVPVITPDEAKKYLIIQMSSD